MVAAGIAAAEWLRRPAIIWVLVVAVLLLGTLVWSRPWRGLWPLVLSAGLAALTAAMALGGRSLSAIEHTWPAVRERFVTQASKRLETELRDALRRADHAAAVAVDAATGDRAAAFRALANASGGPGPELGLALIEPTGVPWAWAGRHRLVPSVEGDSIAVRADGYYVVLEIRRHSPSGRVAVASTLIWAHPTAPRPGGSLSARFAERTRVGLEVFPPGTAPHQADVFDFEEPTTEGPRLLFSVLPVPPDQGEAKERELALASSWVAGAAVVVLLAGVLGAGGVPARVCALAALLWLAIRSPAGAALGFDELYSPATFFRASFGPFTASAGSLGLSSLLLLLGGFWLWRRPGPRPRWLYPVGAVLLVGAPYLITELGRGITPPLNGVPAQLWATWQVVLALTASAVIVLAAACLRPLSRVAPASESGAAWAVGLALAAALIGLKLWVPGIGWPQWYTLLWLPPLFLVARSVPQWGAVMAVAVVGGSAAGLISWAAVLNGRIAVAQRDMSRLGENEDPLAEPLLERLAEQVTARGRMRTAAEMYALWRQSYVGDQDYPVRLTLWDSLGQQRADLTLDSLDLPTSLVSALVRGLDVSGRSITRVSRLPGYHYILLQRLPDRSVFTAAIGPRTRLIAPTRLSRLLRPPAEGPPLYDLTLTPPTLGAPEPIQPGWRRTGWEVRNERALSLMGSNRHVHATVSLHGPLSIAVRGALLILLDAVVIVGVWLLATVRLEGHRRRWTLKRAARSFQVRLAATLAVFFVVPAAGFAAWNFTRFEAEASRGRDLLVSQVLRDAVFTASGLLRGPADALTAGLQDLSDRLDADLALYSGGTLLATSAPILQDLALVEPLLDPRVFVRLGLGDELAQIRNGTTYMAPVRVGYQVVQSGPPGGVGILATPQVAEDWFLAETQRDLAFILLLGTLGGIAAAVVAAQLVARALARPVAELRSSALSLGRGEALPAPQTPPVEFEEVFGAFERMASDIRSSQAALESARRRTAAVLANVATGVLALDAEGAIILANPRAREMLGHPLPEGSSLAAALGTAWATLAGALQRFVAGEEGAVGELEVDRRRLRYQLERLGPDAGAVVLALNDITDVTQAERVLAWGEMARQVAHEIKNPLTPLRLGIQHLQRVHRERRSEFDQTLETTAGRILAEIDRLDTIARAFSRFGLPAEEQAQLETVDLLGIVHEVAELYRLTGQSIAVTVLGNGPVIRPARRDEVKEVIGNLLENARDAGATRIALSVSSAGFSVADDGRGIPAELLPRIFEPRFSTTTSGAGLGLAIVKRLVESWGATVEVQSAGRSGTTVSIAWRDGAPQGLTGVSAPR